MALPETAERRVKPVIQLVLQQTDRRPGAAGRRRCRGRSHVRCPVEAQEGVLLLTFRKMRFDYSFQTLQTHTEVENMTVVFNEGSDRTAGCHPGNKRTRLRSAGT